MEKKCARGGGRTKKQALRAAPRVGRRKEEKGRESKKRRNEAAMGGPREEIGGERERSASGAVRSGTSQIRAGIRRGTTTVTPPSSANLNKIVEWNRVELAD